MTSKRMRIGFIPDLAMLQKMLMKFGVSRKLRKNPGSY